MTTQLVTARRDWIENELRWTFPSYARNFRWMPTRSARAELYRIGGYDYITGIVTVIRNGDNEIFELPVEYMLYENYFKVKLYLVDNPIPKCDYRNIYRYLLEKTRISFKVAYFRVRDIIMNEYADPHRRSAVREIRQRIHQTGLEETINEQWERMSPHAMRGHIVTLRTNSERFGWTDIWSDDEEDDEDDE